MELLAISDAARCAPVACVCIDLAEQLDSLTGKPAGLIATGLLLRVIDGGKYQRLGTFCSTPLSWDYFACYELGLEEYELPSAHDYDAHTDNHKLGYDENEVLHQGVLCNGILCRANLIRQGPIQGTRYFCVACETSYCSRCKEDPENHPGAEFHRPKDNFHRYCRFRVPVKESLFESQEWRSLCIKVSSDRVQGYSSTIMHII